MKKEITMGRRFMRSGCSDSSRESHKVRLLLSLSQRGGSIQHQSQNKSPWMFVGDRSVGDRGVKPLMTGEKTVHLLVRALLWSWEAGELEAGFPPCCGTAFVFGMPHAVLSWELSGCRWFSVSASYIADPNAKSTTRGHYVDLWHYPWDFGSINQWMDYNEA